MSQIQTHSVYGFDFDLATRMWEEKFYLATSLGEDKDRFDKATATARRHEYNAVLWGLGTIAAALAVSTISSNPWFLSPAALPAGFGVVSMKRHLKSKREAERLKARIEDKSRNLNLYPTQRDLEEAETAHYNDLKEMKAKRLEALPEEIKAKIEQGTPLTKEEKEIRYQVSQEAFAAERKAYQNTLRESSVADLFEEMKEIFITKKAIEHLLAHGGSLDLLTLVTRRLSTSKEDHAYGWKELEKAGFAKEPKDPRTLCKAANSLRRTLNRENGFQVRVFLG